MPFSRIRMLDLSHNRISDTGAVDILNSIKKTTILRYLRMFGNRLGDGAAKVNSFNRRLIIATGLKDLLNFRLWSECCCQVFWFKKISTSSLTGSITNGT